MPLLYLWLPLPALFVGFQLVTPWLGHPPSCSCEPNTEEDKNSVHLHYSHSPEDGPLLSVRIYSPPALAALCLPETFPSPAPESLRGRKTATAAATLGYSTVWVENILWCLISTVGKAILTKPINPWASDGTDLIPPAADVPPSLCALLCSDILHSDVLHTPLCTAQKHKFSQWCSVLICKVDGLEIQTHRHWGDALRVMWKAGVSYLAPQKCFDIKPKFDKAAFWLVSDFARFNFCLM